MSFKNKIRVIVIMGASIVSVYGSADGRQPTEFEQYQLELINRARANPNDEVSRLSSLPWGDDGLAIPDLNEGLTPGTISGDSKPPLAFNLDLIDAASDYSDTLLSNDAFAHDFGGTSPAGRMTSAGFPFVSSSGSGENIAVTASTGSHPINQQRVDDHYNGLLIDDGVAGRGHRTNLMDEDWREIGIGIRSGVDYDFFSTPNLNAVLTTQNFAFTSAQGHEAFLTGVVYNDLDSGGFYTPNAGETLGELMVEIFDAGTDTLVDSTTTYGSGGYAISLTGGIYNVLFSGVGVTELFTNVDFTSGQNVKLDAVNPVPEPASLTMLLLVFALWRRRGAERG